MKTQREELSFREIGRGFISSNQEGLTGRRLAKTYLDQNDRMYVKVAGKYEPLTKQHDYLSID